MERFRTSVVEDAFDWSLDPKTLRENYKKANFDALFVKLISKDVIRILSPQLFPEPHNLVYDEGLVYNQLLAPLEAFICGLEPGATQDDLDKALERIKSLNQPSKLCRRILKCGDVTFSCNDCRLDGTSVVCIDCFHKSAHKDHNYMMSHSEGGGCCDCGDAEAWKKDHACTDHASDQPTPTLSDFEDKDLRSKQISDDKKAILEKLHRLPKEVAIKYFLICQACLHYVRLMLIWGDYKSLPDYIEAASNDDPQNAPLTSKDLESKNYFTVVFNDEVHTYDHVINTFVKIIKCTKMTASIMASTVSREGRSFVVNDNYRVCKQVKDMITQVRDPNQGSLKVAVIHGSVLAHQQYALKLIEWIQKMSTISDSFRILTAYTLLGTFDRPADREEPPPGMTLLEDIMLSNTYYWKIARVEWNDLFVTTLLTEYSIKEQFARLLTRHYPRLIQDFIEDDHDHSVSILVMTTQLYTVQSLICMLIEEEDALTTIMKTLVTICKTSRREPPFVTFENRHTFDMHGLKRGFQTISDIRYLITIKPTKWTDQLRNNVIEAVKVLLGLLAKMQGMDSVKRQLGQHLEYEPDWESGMTLQSRLNFCITRLVIYCGYDEKILVASLEETQALLSRSGGFKMISKELYGHQANCIQYDVSTSPVSIHLPLTRFAAALILRLMAIRSCDKTPYDENLIKLASEDNKQLSMIEIMEPSLRTEVMIAQFRIGMWRRNGYSLVNQIMYFHGPTMRQEMLDRDILVLQEGAACTEANQFMIHMINKFDLSTWVVSDTTREPLVGPKAVSFANDEEVLTQFMSLGEEFLQLMLTIISERYRIGVGLIDEDGVTENEIIQLLCIGSATRSEISHKIMVNRCDSDMIKRVANLKRSTEASTGRYELKEELYDRFNPYFYHYSRRHQSTALEAQLKRKKAMKDALICCPPPRPLELTPQFSNLNNLLNCDILLALIYKILRRALGVPEGAQECSTKAPIRFLASDLQLDLALHLIGLGLWEQERQPQSFRYIQSAQNQEIFFMLKDCYDKTKRSKDLIYWLMKKSYDLTETLSATGKDKLDSETLVAIEAIHENFNPILSISDTMKQDSKKKSSLMASQRRDRIMAMMKASQEKFLSNPSTKVLVSETERNEGKHQATESANRSVAGSSSPSSHGQPKAKLAKPSKAELTEDEKSEDQPMECEDSNFVDCSSNCEEQEDLAEPPEVSHLCILCRDEHTIGFEKPTMVLLAFIQRSAVLSKNRSRRIPNYSVTPSNQTHFLDPSYQHNDIDRYSYTSDNGRSFDATFMPADLFFGPHVLSCGHVMHYDCWQGFFEAVKKRENGRSSRNARHVSFELEKNEILCPLCECISNAVIPLLANFTKFGYRRSIPNQPSTIFRATRETINKTAENLSSFLRAMRNSVDAFKHVRHIKDTASHTSFEGKYIRLLQPNSINHVLEDLDEAAALSLRDFINSVRSSRVSANCATKNLLSSLSTLADRIHLVSLDLDNNVTDVNHARIFMMTSWSISYTIQSYERTARLEGSPMFEGIKSKRNLCMSALLRYTCSSMMVYQPDMMQSLLVRKLRYLFINEEHLSSSPCCLDIDAFELFVSLTMLLQKLYAHFDDSSQTSLGNKTEAADMFSSSFGSSTSSRTSDTLNYAWVTCSYDHEYFRNLLNLMLVLNMVQVAISMQNDYTADDEAPSAASEDGTLASPKKDAIKKPEKTLRDEQNALYNFYREIIISSGHPNSKMPQMDEQFCSQLKRRLLPFLRSCAIFYYHLSQCTPPDILRGESASRLDPSEGDAEFDAICSYLDLPDNLSLLFQSQDARLLARSWLRHSRVLLLIASSSAESGGHSSSGTSPCSTAPAQITHTELMPIKFIHQPHQVNRLLELPYDYSELVDKVSNFTCPSIKNEDSRTPTMCLVCGVMLCSQSFCCQRDLNNLASSCASSPTQASSSTNRSASLQQLVGSCTYHAYECSAGVGVFLRIRNCQILLLSGRSKGCYMPAPYIDDHGETDFGLMRGNPLHLNRHHYDRLQQMWLNHAIPEQISRQLEYSPYASNVSWHLH